jgi:hypothetical protein
MPDDINTRMNYFDRQFLRAADFQVEQNYHLDRHRRHNRYLHTPGVATGLGVMGKVGGTAVSVDAGTAIDAQGREIVLLEPKTIQLNDKGKLQVVIHLEETPSTASTDPGVTGLTRMAEQPIIEIIAAQAVPNELALKLAAIQVDDAGQLTAMPDNSIRTLAGIVVGTSGTFDIVTANKLTLNGNPPVQITGDGTVTSPMWTVTQLFNGTRKPGGVNPGSEIARQTFSTGGGTLLIFASGSGGAGPNVTAPTLGAVIAINIFLDDTPTPTLTPRGSIQVFAKPNDLNKVMVENTLLVTGIKKGSSRTLRLLTDTNTKLDGNDFFSVTILELPF